MRSDDGTGDALIGHTGFVGSNLLRRRDFDATYNSSSIGDIDGRRFDAVVCAGAAGVKWWANQNPGEDRVRIEGLMRHLDTIEASHFTLVSTVDVYDTPVGVDEDDEPSPDRLHPYGRNRLMLERHVVDRFADPSRVDYEPDWAGAADRVAGLARPGDFVITLGCGSVYRIVPQLLEALGNRTAVSRPAR